MLTHTHPHKTGPNCIFYDIKLMGGDTVPYAGVRAGDDFHLVDYPRPVRLLGEVHSQVSTVGIDG